MGLSLKKAWWTLFSLAFQIQLQYKDYTELMEFNIIIKNTEYIHHSNHDLVRDAVR